MVILMMNGNHKSACNCIVCFLDIDRGDIFLPKATRRTPREAIAQRLYYTFFDEQINLHYLQKLLTFTSSMFRGPLRPFCKPHMYRIKRVLPQPVSPITITGILHLMIKTSTSYNNNHYTLKSTLNYFLIGAYVTKIPFISRQTTAYRELIEKVPRGMHCPPTVWHNVLERK